MSALTSTTHSEAHTNVIGFRWTQDVPHMQARKLPGWTRPAVLFLFDLFAAVVCFFGMQLAWFSRSMELAASISLIASALSATVWVGGYRRRVDFRSLQFTVDFLVALSIATGVGFFMVALTFNYGIGVQSSRGWLFTWPIPYFAASLIFKRWVGTFRNANEALPATLVIGTPDQARILQQEITHHGTPSLVTAISPEELMELCEKGASLSTLFPRLETIVFCSDPACSQSCLTRLLTSHISDVPVLTWDGFYEHHLKKVSLDKLHATWLFAGDFRLAPWSLFCPLKRVFDLLSVVIAIPFVLPLGMLISLTIWMDSRGPVFFRQNRIGRFGQPFSLLKFRSMKPNSTGGTTSRGDNRVTRIGQFLRKYRLDELPQLWNVLLGHMSLIGPRPEWTACVEAYEKDIPLYHLRHAVRPGLTGWAQVNYSYGEDVEDAKQKFAYDLYYLRHFSASLDIAICLKTVFVVVFGRGGR